KGFIEPWIVHDYYVNTFGWGQFFDAGAASELTWVMLREISLGYQIPTSLTNRIRVKNAGLRFSVRNLGYLYNSLPADQNPASIQSNNPFNPVITGAVPYSRNYSITVNISL
ncbi:MAG TPA: hypothetical protein VFS31_15885, partial [Chitinophagaceae bacterium]|nr:hypothetical protein [Chitinophagaceae bacterium]